MDLFELCHLDEVWVIEFQSHDLNLPDDRVDDIFLKGEVVI